MEESAKSVQLQEEIGEGNWKDNFSNELRLCMWVGTTIQSFRQLPVMNTIVYYGLNIFSDLGVDNLQTTAITDVVTFVATCLTVGNVDKVGRVSLRLFGAIGMCISAVLVGIFFSSYFI